MATFIPEVSELLSTAREAFVRQFDVEPEKAAYAPGRVNLIGEHTDYNDGFVLPMALQMATVVVGRRTSNTSCRLLTLADIGDETYVEFLAPRKDQRLPTSPIHWSNYVIGVVQHYHGPVFPFDVVIVSSVPFGGGVSSSASLQVAIYTLLDEFNNIQTGRVSLKDKAKRCMDAEHEYIGLMDGIMDQSLESFQIRIQEASVIVLLTNSNVRHELINTEYPTRTQQCKDVAAVLGVGSLRDVSLQQLKAKKDRIDPVLFKRAHHVITEIKRTSEAARALERNDVVTMGQLMVDSHNSLRDDYAVSCAELDELVIAALEVEGVYGSRMTGGGFGGCTVTLVKPSCINQVIHNIQTKYSKKATFYICKPSGGSTGIIV